MANRAFSFKDYDAIGFDLDNCLVRYKVSNCLKMEYKVLADFLVERGYSKEFLLKPLENHSDFLQKGLILDFEKGNLLRVCPDGNIQICSHGTQKMTRDEISSVYKDSRWFVTDAYCKDLLCAWNGSLAELIRCCIDIFDMPAALAFARIIDSLDTEYGRKEKYKVWPDILDGLMTMYGRENFSNDKSKYFQEIRQNPRKYVHENSVNVSNWLKNLKKERKTFLVTGSHIDFASLTASIALGENWRELFDIVICFAKKPGFFTSNRPFLTLDGTKESEAANELKLGEIYTQGNFVELKKSLGLKQDAKILYVGDNLIQDVFTPSKHMNIDTIAIVEELLVEGETFDKEYEILHSKFWGNYFHHLGNSTLWETIIKNHAKLCVPSVEHLAIHPVDFQFKTDEGKDVYFPHTPNFDFRE